MFQFIPSGPHCPTRHHCEELGSTLLTTSCCQLPLSISLLHAEPTPVPQPLLTGHMLHNPRDNPLSTSSPKSAARWRGSMSTRPSWHQTTVTAQRGCHPYSRGQQESSRLITGFCPGEVPQETHEALGSRVGHRKNKTRTVWNSLVLLLINQPASTRFCLLQIQNSIKLIM